MAGSAVRADERQTARVARKEVRIAPTAVLTAPVTVAMLLAAMRSLAAAMQMSVHSIPLHPKRACAAIALKRKPKRQHWAVSAVREWGACGR